MNDKRGRRQVNLIFWLNSFCFELMSLWIILSTFCVLYIKLSRRVAFRRSEDSRKKIEVSIKYTILLNMLLAGNKYFLPKVFRGALPTWKLINIGNFRWINRINGMKHAILIMLISHKRSVMISIFQNGLLCWSRLFCRQGLYVVIGIYGRS